MRISFNKQAGISFIELIIFIVILSTALTAITLIYINATRSSADPMVRIRAVELAQSTMEEILLKRYDEATPVGGGCVDNMTNTRCSSQPDAIANVIGNFGPDGETSRATYDDVDDYHNLLYCGDNATATASACPSLTCTDMLDESGTDISAEYAGFSVCIKVSFAGGIGAAAEINPGTGVDVLTNDAKRIDVIVTDPVKSQIFLSGYKLNF